MTSFPRSLGVVAALLVIGLGTPGHAATEAPPVEKQATPAAPAPAPIAPAVVEPSAAIPAPKDVPPPKQDTIENSVVKIFATVRAPAPFQPWTKQPPHEITATGVVIEGKHILTNAHVALYATQVQIQANQSGDKLSATVEFVAPGIDLAVLKLDDESFFATHPAVVRAAKLPSVKDSVLVYGFPTGGTNLSITKGI
ncbi:MAG: serine protease, partial [Lacunisphaera sp.]